MLITARPLPFFIELLPIIYTLSLNVTLFLLRQLKFVLLFSSVIVEFLGLMANELTDRCLSNSSVQYFLAVYDELGLFINGRSVGGALR
jgi:hypothetical protein